MCSAVCFRDYYLKFCHIAWPVIRAQIVESLRENPASSFVTLSVELFQEILG